MLTIEIANEGVWNAVTCAALGTQYVVLENFRVHPFQNGAVKMRYAPVDPAALRLQEGTPVTVDGEDGVVITPNPHMPMIKFAGDVVRIVPAAKVAYRMGTTIDALHEVPAHEMKTFRDVPYLVPKARGNGVGARDDVVTGNTQEKTTSAATNCVDSEEEEEEETTVRHYKKKRRIPDPSLPAELLTALAPHLDELRYNNATEEDGQPMYRHVNSTKKAITRYQAAVRHKGTLYYLGAFADTTVAAVAVCAFRLDQTKLSTTPAIKKWMETMARDRAACRAWIDAHVTY